MTVKQFGASGPSTDFGQFGSKTAAAPQTSQNPSVIMQLAAWATGWTAAAVGAAFNPYLEDMNGFCLTVMYFIASLFERGIPDWDSGTTYYKGAVVQDPAGSGQYFFSLTDNNLANALPLSASNAQWQWLNAPQVPIGASIEFMGIVLPSAFLWEDGTAYSRATYASLFAALNLSMNGTLTAGLPTVTGIASTAQLKAGWYVSGTGIPSGATILSVDSANQITLSANATASATNPLVLGPWGIGDGVTTFNVPDTRRRVGVGSGGAATAELGNVLGSLGGEETHVLTTAEIPSHTHDLPAISGRQGGASGATGNGPPDPANPSGATGGDGAHNNIQPSYVCTKIIKAL